MKTILGITPVIISFFNLVYYLYHVYFGRVRPHLFSWIIWALVAAIAAAGQVVKGAGAGAWISIAIAVFAVIRVIACVTHGEKDIKRSDWYCMAACLFAIALWLLTNDPLSAVVIVSIIDAVGMYPTMRKSWFKPYEESAFSYFLFGLVSLLGLLSTEQYNVTTVIYPLSVLIMCWPFVIFLLVRRKLLVKYDR